MRVNVLHNTQGKLKYNKIHKLVLINKVISIVIIRLDCACARARARVHVRVCVCAGQSD
jgi:hypothetical protein